MKMTHQYLYSEKHCNLLWWYWQQNRTHYTCNASEEGKEVGLSMRDGKAKLSCQSTPPSLKRLRVTATLLFIVQSAFYSAQSCRTAEGQRRWSVKIKVKVATADLIQSFMKCRGNASDVQCLPWWLQTGMFWCLLINIQQTRGGLLWEANECLWPRSGVYQIVNTGTQKLKWGQQGKRVIWFKAVTSCISLSKVMIAICHAALPYISRTKIKGLWYF